MKKIKLFAVMAFLLISSYSFSQWTYAGGPSGLGTYPSISVVDPNLIYLGGGAPGTALAFVSTNAGVIFTPIGTTGLVLDIFSVWGIDANTLYSCDGGNAGGTTGGNAHLYKTTNGGTLWTVVDSTNGTAGFFNGIVFSRTFPLVGFAESDPPSGAGGVYYVRKTTNGGVNWIAQAPPGITNCASASNTLFIIDQNFYGFGTSGTGLAANVRSIITSDGGTTWYNAQLTGSPTGSSQAFVSSLTFNSNKLIGLGGSSNTSNTISRTTNGGTSWTSLTIPSSLTAASFFASFVPNSNTVYMLISGTSTQAFKSTNSGANWTTLTWAAGITSKVTQMEAIYSSGSAYVYAVCADGSVCKLVDPVTDVNTNNTVIPSEYKLEQNFPNPFNPSTTINYSIPKESNVTLKVYNILGSEVKTLVNEKQSVNNYTITADFSNLPSGIYYYTLKAGDFTMTKKLMLVK